jgi:hypothetical protein
LVVEKRTPNPSVARLPSLTTLSGALETFPSSRDGASRVGVRTTVFPRGILIGSVAL